MKILKLLVPALVAFLPAAAPAADSSIRPDRRSASPSSEARVTAQNRFSTSTARLRNAFRPTNPTTDCDFNVSTVTTPASPSHVSSPVSDLMGPAAAPGNPPACVRSNDRMREPCRNGTESGNPGVK